MTTLNQIDIGNVLQEALASAKNAAKDSWPAVSELADNIARSILIDLEYVARQKVLGQIDEYGAKIFLEDQRMVARARLRSLAIVTLQLAEDIINAMLRVFNAAAQKALGWLLFPVG
ncbi:hypothetical protein [Arsukibacterium indicum]|uniref:Uncharacterized protein n=1 Tax=Arsukibacterium indicum TaxID=2848612 RepID=A0ABS6MPR9_9GAMM|nr:hypothetical protein [Arsukibacterium indicum]MBV2130818.1 hypothetical protein [Arsukibacterium indicum]